jgi:hypothetical protein
MVKKIRKNWENVFELFRRFHAEGRLVRLIGNHDLNLLFQRDLDIPVYESLRYQAGIDQSTGKPNEVFIFHGHQASRWYALFNDQLGMALKYVLKPLPFKNYSVSHNNRRKKKLEERVYRFSSRNQIVSIIGHTHRPLFESLSKADSVKYNIERLCRQYSTADSEGQQRIYEEIQDLKRHVGQLSEERKRDEGSIYHEDYVVPCMFNSGCVLGKRGITCIEMTHEDISLAYWFDKQRSKRYFRYDGYETDHLTGTEYYRTIIKNERWDYIFSRIRLLS